MAASMRSRTSLVLRTVLWIILSSIFILSNARRISEFHTAGYRAPWLVLIQLAIWCMALAFWLYTGWRDWTRFGSD